MKFQVFKTSAGQWRWRLRATNGRIIANSGESYKRRIDCNTALALVRKADPDTPIELLYEVNGVHKEPT